jgi:hypothetical protein
MSRQRVQLDAPLIARLEAQGWRAYYDHDWGRLVRLIVQLNQAQFHIPFPLSVVAAYHVARGSAAWVPVEHDEDEVRRHFVRFYRMARRWSGLTFDPVTAARLEIDYWIEHRRLYGDPNKGPFVDAMTALHAHLFDLPPTAVRESAEWRVEANNTVDLITGQLSADPDTDWAVLEDQLLRCYRSIQQALDRAD